MQAGEVVVFLQLASAFLRNIVCYNLICSKQRKQLRDEREYKDVQDTENLRECKKFNELVICVAKTIDLF